MPEVNDGVIPSTHLCVGLVWFPLGHCGIGLDHHDFIMAVLWDRRRLVDHADRGPFDSDYHWNAAVKIVRTRSF